MIVIVGLVVLLVAVIVAITGVLANAGPAHPLTGNFSVLGYHVTGSTGMLFLDGIIVGVVGLIGLGLVVSSARRTARRGRVARGELTQARLDVGAVGRDRDRLAAQQRDPVESDAQTLQPMPEPMAATSRRLQ